MRRRDFIALLGSAAAWPLAARPQQPGRIYRIGFLANDPALPTEPVYRAFLDELRNGGFIEGNNVAIEHRFADAKLDRYPELAAELVRIEADVIVTLSTPATLAAKRATNKIPIVMVSVADPVGQGVVESLASPGGNVTGLAQTDSTEISAKQLQLFKLAVPHIGQVAVLLNPDLLYAQSVWEQLEKAAPPLNLTLRRFTARQASDFEDVFAAIARDHPDALFIAGAGALGFVNRRLIMDLAARNKLPVMAVQRPFVEAGSLLSYGYVLHDSLRKAATYVVKILKGANPADLPVELPTKYELVINLKVARALGLNLSNSFLQLADEVIE
jgi:putative tryptophan/tyrosine transport system substrate-binding protein